MNMKGKLSLAVIVGIAVGITVPALYRPQPVQSAQSRSYPKLEYRLVPITVPPPARSRTGTSPTTTVETADQTAERLTRTFNKLADDGWEQVAVISSGQGLGTFVLFKRSKK